MNHSFAWLCLSLIGLSACGSNKTGSSAGGSNKTDNCTSPPMASLNDLNTVALVVDRGPPEVARAYTNGLFASVRLCVPGTTTCQTIDHLLVDTGSIGVRILESLVTLPLASATTDTGSPLAGCVSFLDGSAAWGPIRIADVYLGQELAGNIPIHTIGDELTFTQIPANCTGTPMNNLNDLGSNGILGVGLHKQDCGANCAATENPGRYYACTSPQKCSPTVVPVERQVANPVAAFPVDNNGVIIQLPCVPPGGSRSVSGVMVFGIGTQPNNGLGTATPLTVDRKGFMSTAYPGDSMPYTSFLDTGSNALFFLDEPTSGIKACTGTGLQGFYCPSSTTNLTAQMVGRNGASVSVGFSVTNAATLPASSNAFSDLAGELPGYFDWGLPFYFGRSVYTAIEDQPTPVGPGPYFAF